MLHDDDDDDDARGNQDTYWSESDRQLTAQCQGLMKASGASLRKLSSAVRNNGTLDGEENIAQLDDLADAAKQISPRCVAHRENNQRLVAYSVKYRITEHCGI